VVLVGRTYEERLDEFEELLVREFELSPTDVYFVEAATRSHDSDLFTVRSIVRRHTPLPSLLPQELPSAGDAWRRWFWDTDRGEGHRVFNSFVRDVALPPHILLHLVPEIPESVASAVAARLLPGFPAFRDAIITSLLEDVGVEESLWATVWCDIQTEFATTPSSRPRKDAPSDVVPHLPFDIENDLFAWSRQAYRPVLAVKIWHDNDIAGAYLLFGDDQVYDREGAYARLDDLGVELCEILQPPPELTEEALRRESLRRLSDIMHRLNGPLLNAQDALGDIQQFLRDQPAVAEMLVPNEEQAKAMAAMNRDSSDVRYRLSSRFETLAAAVDQIRGLSMHVKTLARIEERLEFADFALKELALDLEKYNSSIRPTFSYSGTITPETCVRADRDLILVALGRVVDNSIREFQERHIASPLVTVTFSYGDGRVRIEIEDNALPEDEQLPARVFDERVSKYFRSNKGSGFGLMSVRRIFERHKADVSLSENVDVDGVRRAGVTFRASLPLANREEQDRE
jgi:signal transduction histidine kinase